MYSCIGNVQKFILVNEPLSTRLFHNHRLEPMYKGTIHLVRTQQRGSRGVPESVRMRMEGEGEGVNRAIVQLGPVVLTP